MERIGCLFCNIVARTTPANIVFENDHVLAFKDIRPVAPSHALVVPKKHIVTVHDATAAGDIAMLGQLLAGAREVAAQLGLADGGYRLVINHGANAGQSVLHLHCHVLGGRPMTWPPG